MKCGICQQVRNPQVHTKEWDYVDGKFVCSECLKKLPQSDGQPRYKCATCRGDASNGIQNPLGNSANFCSKECFYKYMSMFTDKADKLEPLSQSCKSAKHDPVDHPKHYTTHPSGVECIQITRHMNFNLGNAIKYIWRCGDKGNPIEDLKKAIWYLQDEIKRIENETPNRTT